MLHETRIASIRPAPHHVRGFRALLEISQRDKKGLTFYIGGQTIGGAVVAILDNGAAVEIANRTQSRIVIRMDRVDAIALS